MARSLAEQARVMGLDSKKEIRNLMRRLEYESLPPRHIPQEWDSVGDYIRRFCAMNQLRMCSRQMPSAQVLFEHNFKKASLMLTEKRVAALKKGDILYHNVVEFQGEDGILPGTAVVRSVKMVGGKPTTISIKRNYGDKGIGEVSVEGRKFWRLAPEKDEEDKNVLPTDMARPTPRRVIVHTPPVKTKAKEPEPEPEPLPTRVVLEEDEGEIPLEHIYPQTTKRVRRVRSK